MRGGFFPASAPFSADAVLALEVVMGIGLTFGAWAARTRRYRLHAWCQSAIVLVNLPVIAIAMAPSFLQQVAPRIPEKLGRPFYAVATLHGFLGCAAEIFALYIVASAGTNWLPRRLRIANYKIAMRGLFALWWLALLMGLAVFLRWYVPHAF
jgi:hypothetical protein